MQTNLTRLIKETHKGKEAESILRSCVHCGFCLATCPTYQILNNELDSPRGRIYLMKEVLEGKIATKKTQLHLDRCLTCRGCETTCPSGVQYGKLIDICREVVEKQATRSIKIKTIRYLFEAILGINLLIITRILGLKLSSKIFSWVFSNLGPKLNISNQAKENLLIAFPNIKDSEINTIIFKMWLKEISL